MQTVCITPGCRRAADPNVSQPPTLCISCYYRYPDMNIPKEEPFMMCCHPGCIQNADDGGSYCHGHATQHRIQDAIDLKTVVGAIDAREGTPHKKSDGACTSPGCYQLKSPGFDLCAKHRKHAAEEDAPNPALQIRTKLVPESATGVAGAPLATRMSTLYPKYYKDVSQYTEIDVYAVHHLFNIQDPSGIIQHASKKLLLSGVRTGGKSKRDDIREARDTLNRWLELNPEVEDK